MWPMGHVGVAYILYTISTRFRHDQTPSLGPTVILLFGSLFPDLVDKPLSWYLGVLPTGRTLAHSLLVLIPLCAVVYLVTRYYDRSEYGVAFTIGALSHSLIDVLPVFWDEEASANFLLWPYLSVPEYENGAPSVMELLSNSLSSLYFLSEFVFLAVALVLWNTHRKRDNWRG